MFAEGKSKRMMTACVVVVLALCFAILSLADVRMPEASGKSVVKKGDLVVDNSHMDQGYIMIKATKSKKRYKVRITTSGAKLNYDLNSNGDYEVFPLQFGNGKYEVGLYRQASGTKYEAVGKASLKVKMEDELSCFLYPNQYVNYDETTPCVVAAAEMCSGMTDQAEIFKTVCNYIKSNFVYDFIKSVTVGKGVLPDIDGCWSSRMGICQDLSAMACAMLRSQGVPARLMIGTLGVNTYHAWVMAVVNGEDKFFDPTAELNASSKTDTYTTERYY